MKEIAKILLDIEAVTLQPEEPFTWASGIKAPIYCDNRLLLSYPKERHYVLTQMANIIKEKFPEVEYIMGTATAGIPHGAILAEQLELPMGYVRSKAKGHGKGRRIEGVIQKGAKTVVIEDLFSTGGSSIEAAKTVEEEGFQVLGILSIFTYDLEKAKENFHQAGFEHYSLTNFPELVSVAVEEGKISKDSVDSLEIWRKNPSDESWIK
ncbi:MAG: orotate phosphoribosyltransferase [Tissierellia bacterium]|nr:orotate phosphoribosyltransferase [Tissierellia bacterium]